MLCVHYLYISKNVDPGLWGLWERYYYTASISGLPGRCVPLDGLMEKINRYAKQLLGLCITPHRVQTIVPLLNVLLKMYDRVARAWGRPGRRWAYMGAPTFDDDIKMICRLFLYQHAGDMHTAVCADATHTLLQVAGRFDTLPNSRVARVNADWRTYVQGKEEALRF